MRAGHAPWRSRVRSRQAHIGSAEPQPALARGEFFMLVQGDYCLPDARAGGGLWMLHALRAFRALPRLAMLSGRVGYDDVLTRETPEAERRAKSWGQAPERPLRFEIPSGRAVREAGETSGGGAKAAVALPRRHPSSRARCDHLRTSRLTHLLLLCSHLCSHLQHAHRPCARLSFTRPFTPPFTGGRPFPRGALRRAQAARRQGRRGAAGAGQGPSRQVRHRQPNSALDASL